MEKYKWLDGFVMGFNGVTKDFKAEWGWTRYKIGDKMFLAVCKDEDGNDSLITLKLPPQQSDFMRKQYSDIIPGYYMNKVHWSSIKIDGDVPDNIVKELAQTAYSIVFASLTKKLQKEINEQ